MEQEKNYTEIFRQSSYWQNKDLFLLRDICKLCSCNNKDAKKVVRDLMAREVVRGYYQKPNINPLLHKKWREPLEWDGIYTPKYC